ncbi:uncharacterized protein LOC582363 [Strongylocentrotus purpuratus]|uniref:Uncharacterized protein n=1 Tax=Strongylocentrotus purpuratus TaxID=7668 RepID=A0A7M7NS99_STRPU|nr:uncharacterized protein LOC582363 [Strongylocentrotus purpuratus]|eukprot:XP_011678525.1 PREDICTED: uncharacterized protein LOC582363 [Strongylocentrotus purpuratus]
MDVSVVLGTALVAAGFVFTLFCNFQAAIGPDSEYSLGWFNSTIGNLSGEYPSPITPAGYAFSIWSLIYLWMAVWILYIIMTLFRTNARGPVYLNPPVTSLPFLLSVFLGNCLNILWLFVWDREMLTVSAIVLVSSTLVLYVALMIILTRVWTFLREFLAVSSADLWACRVLVGNGLAIYCAWTTIAAQVAVSVSLLYDAGLPSDTVVYICLSVLAAELIVFFALDVSILDPYTRHVFTIYPVFIWALSALLVANSEETDAPQFLLGAILLGISCVCFVTKTLLSIFRPALGEYGDRSAIKFKQLI